MTIAASVARVREASPMIDIHHHDLPQGLSLMQRLLWRRYGVRAQTVLNPDGGADVPPAAGFAAELLRQARSLQAEAYGADGRLDYGRLAGSPAYGAYCEATARLRRFDTAGMADRHERLAFWINLYNALIVDAVIRFGVRQSVREVPGFFVRAAYNVGGLRLSADDIEHGILRANAGHPALPGPQFGGRDPRRRLALETLDPRIHFALVCAARACPPLRSYDAERIDEQLERAARAFINAGGVQLEPGTGQVRLSQIFRWFAPDFGAAPLALGWRAPLVSFVLRYLDDPAARAALEAGGGRPCLGFLRYDWRLNGAPAGPV
jgi:hypothetical protein